MLRLDEYIAESKEIVDKYGAIDLYALENIAMVFSQDVLFDYLVASMAHFFENNSIIYNESFCYPEYSIREAVKKTSVIKDKIVEVCKTFKSIKTQNLFTEDGFLKYEVILNVVSRRDSYLCKKDDGLFDLEKVFGTKLLNNEKLFPNIVKRKNELELLEEIAKDMLVKKQIYSLSDNEVRDLYIQKIRKKNPDHLTRMIASNEYLEKMNEINRKIDNIGEIEVSVLRRDLLEAFKIPDYHELYKHRKALAILYIYGKKSSMVTEIKTIQKQIEADKEKVESIKKLLSSLDDQKEKIDLINSLLNSENTIYSEQIRIRKELSQAEHINDLVTEAEDKKKSELIEKKKAYDGLGFIGKISAEGRAIKKTIERLELQLETKNYSNDIYSSHGILLKNSVITNVSKNLADLISKKEKAIGLVLQQDDEIAQTLETVFGSKSAILDLSEEEFKHRFKEYCDNYREKERKLYSISENPSEYVRKLEINILKNTRKLDDKPVYDYDAAEHFFDEYVTKVDQANSINDRTRTQYFNSALVTAHDLVGESMIDLDLTNKGNSSLGHK